MLLCVRNRIESAGMKRVTFADSFEPEPKTVNHTMLMQGINAIVRTAGVEAAALAEPRTDQLLVKFDQHHRCAGR
jgi:hypothetical protein